LSPGKRKRRRIAVEQKCEHLTAEREREKSEERNISTSWN
jgi:hypothetical protein